jgi:OmcA/MtrC family decaheme c-type cytochrome
MNMHSRGLAALALAAAAIVGSGCAEVRPDVEQSRGLRLAIEGATVNANRQVEVTYRLTDAAGVARGRDAVTSSWTLASLSSDAFGNPLYVAHVRTGQDVTIGGVTEKQPGAETEDATTASQDLGGGRFKYTFQTQLPEGFATGATYRVGVYSRLQVNPGAATPEYDEEQPNAVLDFVPAGGAPQSRAVANEAACNVCHTEVRAHGGFRRGVAICTTCHTTQLYDPDTIDPAKLEPANPLDLARLVHRIHRGRQLQTVQNVLAAARPTGTPPAPPPNQAEILASPFARYAVVGFQGRTFTFGEARIRTENGVPVLGAAGVNLPPPNDVRNCGACHAGAKDESQHLSVSARRVCTACHADVVFEASQVDAYHIPHTTNLGPSTDGLFTNDGSCRGCHAQEFAPPGAQEFSRWVDLAHTVPVQSTQLRDLKVEIVDFATTGATPVLVFKVTNGDGTPVPSLAAPDMSSIRATLNGPTRPDYLYFNNYFQEDLANTTANPQNSTFDAASGNWTHVFARGLPAGATDTWALAIEARRSVTVPNPDEPPPAGATATTSITEGARNEIRYFRPGGGEVQPRQLAVSQERCNACHLELQFHGNQRENVEYCVVCHTADLTDWTRRPKTGSGASAVVNLAATPDNREERSVHFKPMIHRIHMGNGLEAQKPYVIYGFGGPVFLDESGLPETSRARCTACHVGDSYKLEAMPPRLPTFANDTAEVKHTPGSGDPKLPTVAPVGPMTSACLSCHDYDDPTLDNTPGVATGTPAAPGWRDAAPGSLLQHVRAYTSTAPGPSPTEVQFVERCVECHSDRGVASVSGVHRVAAAE